MVFFPSFSAISIANRGSAWDGWRGGVEGGKMPCLRHPMSNHDTYTVVNNIPVGHSHWEQTLVPTAQLAPSMGAIVPSVTLEGQQMPFRKADQLIFNT